jgi:hypothetical protein
MLPLGGLNDLYYPMTADVFYSIQERNDFGEVKRTWIKDRTIKCSAIKERPDSKIRPTLTVDKIIDYDFRINMRTVEDVLVSSDETIYGITEVLVSNFRDSSGTPVWVEVGSKNTNFFVSTIEPMFDDLHNVAGYRTLLIRSQKQESLSV